MTHSWRNELHRDGFVSTSAPLADSVVVPDLLADRAEFDVALAEIQASGQVRVPYLTTEAIARVSQDEALSSAVRSMLGTDEWVMWGSNIRAATPNAAHRWHVDLESFLWPSSVTVAVGLAGCVPEGATWFLPGTHRLSRGPRGGDDLDTDRVAARARSLGHRGDLAPTQIGGFGDAGFYAFNARCWHRGDPTRSEGRVVLFTHFQRADEPRIPTMLDYRINQWSREPAPYLASPACRSVNETVHRPPWTNVVGGWVRRLRLR